MLSIITTGLIGLLGTALGGWLSHRQQQRAAQSERAMKAEEWERQRVTDSERRAVEQNEKWREMRRLAAVTLVKQIDGHAEASRAYWEALDDPTLEVDIEELKRAHVTSWQALASDLASFQLSVTPQLSQEGATFYNAVRDYSEAVDNVAKKRRGARADAEHAQAAVEQARRHFIAAAQTDLDPLSVPADPAPIPTP